MGRTTFLLLAGVLACTSCAPSPTSPMATMGLSGVGTPPESGLADYLQSSHGTSSLTGLNDVGRTLAFNGSPHGGHGGFDGGFGGFGGGPGGFGFGSPYYGDGFGLPYGGFGGGFPGGWGGVSPFDFGAPWVGGLPLPVPVPVPVPYAAGVPPLAPFVGAGVGLSLIHI